MKVAIIGAGLAGSECAWALAEYYKVNVTLFEKKKHNPTPAQDAPHLYAELVCSNSLKSKSLLNPSGTLKIEMQKLGSLLLKSAYRHEVPAGETLAVDRELFSQEITQSLQKHPLIDVQDVTITQLDDLLMAYDAVVVATGPLTDIPLSEYLKEKTGAEKLYFYDAIAPIIDGETIDYSQVFKANRMSKTHLYELKNKPQETLSQLDEGDYLNLGLDKEPYFEFVRRLNEGPKLPHHDFEEPRYFNGCQPIEVLAEKGPKTLAFGPMKPKGLIDPKTNRMPYAVVQLRKEHLGDQAWNMVGFQTRLTWPAQKEIFRTLPGLQKAEFFRMGSMHRNTYMISPHVLKEDLSFKINSKLYLAGQIMGVEGYLESAASGLFIGHMIGQKLCFQRTLPLPPPNTSLGALMRYCVFAEAKYFAPMNINWGLFDPLSEEDLMNYGKINGSPKKMEKSLKKELLSKRSLALFEAYSKNLFPEINL